MEKNKEQEWRDAYYVATSMVGKRGLETAALTIGIMFQKTVDEAVTDWLARMDDWHRKDRE